MHPAILYESLSDGSNSSLRCLLCSHYCTINENKTGTCGLRTNIGGKLYTSSWGMAGNLAIDPMEKKPFFNFKPGTRVLSFGTPGCNFRCLNCQNWQLSQFVRQHPGESLYGSQASPEHIAQTALQHKVDGIAYTYSEPTIFFEYARDTILACRDIPQNVNLSHVFVSNGYFSKETLELISNENLIDAVNIDLKFIDDQKYRNICGSKLKPVLDSIRRVWELRDKIFIEIINLVIPGENDSDEDFERISEFIKSVSPSIPLHFSRFYPQHRMTGKQPTELSRLKKAKKIAESYGLEYIYLGNTNINGAEDTYCPNCKTLLISRSRFGINHNVFKGMELEKNPECPVCGYRINIIL